MLPFRPRRTRVTRRGVFSPYYYCCHVTLNKIRDRTVIRLISYFTSVNLDSLKIRSAVGKSALIHSIIADDNIDVLCV